MRARFSFDPALWLFLEPARRGHRFEYDCARAASLKNAIEALGVPHTEVGALRVNGEPATLQRIVREGDSIEVETAKSGSDPDFRFVADAHLGGLARFLRMLGFDTLYRNAFADEEIRRLADAERRIVLTRDRELLKCQVLPLRTALNQLNDKLLVLHDVSPWQARPCSLRLSLTPLVCCLCPGTYAYMSAIPRQWKT